MHVERYGKGLHVSVGEELTIYQVRELYDAIMQVMDDDCDLYMDLSKVRELDTSGVQLCLAFCKKLNSQDRQLKLVDVSPEARASLDLFQLDILSAAEISQDLSC